VFNPRRTGEELRAHRFAERHSDGDGPGDSPSCSARLMWSYTVVLLCTQGRETTISMAKGLVQMVFVGMGLAVVSRKSSGGGGRYWSSAYLSSLITGADRHLLAS